MSSVRKGVLEGRGSALAAFVLFSCLGAWAWTTITNSHHFVRDPVYLGGLLFAVFITVSVAYRSPLHVDRIAFGASAVAFLLATIVAIAPLGPGAMLVVSGAKALMWTVAAVVGLVVLARGSNNLQEKG